MAKKWKYFKTTYSEAWIAFRKSAEYVSLSETLKNKGIKQPYRDNIIKQCFAAGFRASGVKIEVVP